MNTTKMLKEKMESYKKIIEGYEKDQEKYEEAIDDLLENAFEYSIDKEVRCFLGEERLLGYEIILAFGGPTIWVDTRECKILGRWGDRIELSLSGESCELLDDLITARLGDG